MPTHWLTSGRLLGLGSICLRTPSGDSTKELTLTQTATSSDLGRRSIDWISLTAGWVGRTKQKSFNSLAVQQFSDGIRMTGVPCSFVDHVEEHPSKIFAVSPAED